MKANLRFGRRVLPFAVSLALGVAGGLPLSQSALAVGLGRITVSSGLGDPLRAEIELVSLQPGEAETLRARIAGPEAFQLAGIDYAQWMSSVRLDVRPTPDGRQVIVVSSSVALNEPAVDLLVELESSAGRLVRQFEFFLDPPNYQTADSTSRINPPEAGGSRTAPSVASGNAAASDALQPVRPPPPPSRAAARTVPSAATKQPEMVSTGDYEVKSGDTLGKIAAALRPETVTLEQMVVALYRSNQDAFINGNLNLVRAGRVLRVPAPDAAAAIGQTEARQVLATQGQAWLAYRNELARGAVQSPAVDKDSAQSASGQVSTTAKPPARQAGDRVRLGADAGKGTAPAGDDAAARARELNKLNADLAAVEKNIKDLQKLQTLKSDTLARAEKGAAEKGAAEKGAAANSAKPAEKGAEKTPAAATPSATAAAGATTPGSAAASTTAPSTAAPGTTAPGTAVPVIAAPVTTTSSPAVPPAAPKAAERELPDAAMSKPGAPATTASAPPPPKPAAPALPTPTVTKVTPPPPAPPESSFLDEMSDFVSENVAAVGGALAALLLGAGFMQYRRRRSSHSMQIPDEADFSTSAAEPPASTDANSMFGATGGRTIDTSTSAQGLLSRGELSQAAIGVIDTEEVDPVAEADVYMAYGRDAQAEEILREALQKDPGRHEVRSKLLEIYAGRGDVKAFEAAAGALYVATQGEGPEWDRAAALGAQLDSSNPMYASAQFAAPAGHQPAHAASDSMAPDSMAQNSIEPNSMEPLSIAPNSITPDAMDFPATTIMGNHAGELTRGLQEAADSEMTFDLDLGDRPEGQHSVLDLDLSGSASNDMDLVVDSPSKAASADDNPSVLTIPVTRPVPSTRSADKSPAPAAAPAAPARPGASGVPPTERFRPPGAAPRSAVPAIPKTEGPIPKTVIAASSTPSPIPKTMAPAPKAVAPIPKTSAPAARTPTLPTKPAFDPKLDEPIGATAPSSVIDTRPAAGHITSLDFGSIDLSLGPASVSGPVDQDAQWQETATKLDLAKVYREMGHMDDARELLIEVIKDGDAAQQEQARKLMESIG